MPLTSSGLVTRRNLAHSAEKPSQPLPDMVAVLKFNKDKPESKAADKK